MTDPALAQRIQSVMSDHHVSIYDLLMLPVFTDRTYQEVARMVERGHVSLAGLRDLSQAIGCTMAELCGTTRPVRVSCHLDGRGCIRKVQNPDGTWSRA